MDSAYCVLSRAAVRHAAHESHVAVDNAIVALVTGTTPLQHMQASSLDSAYCELVELSRHLVRMRTGEEGWRICPASLVARVPGKLTLTV